MALSLTTTLSLILYSFFDDCQYTFDFFLFPFSVTRNTPELPHCMRQGDVLSRPVQGDKSTDKLSQIFVNLEQLERSSKDVCFIFHKNT